MENINRWILRLFRVRLQRKRGKNVTIYQVGLQLFRVTLLRNKWNERPNKARFFRIYLAKVVRQAQINQRKNMVPSIRTCLLLIQYESPKNSGLNLWIFQVIDAMSFSVCKPEKFGVEPINNGCLTLKFSCLALTWDPNPLRLLQWTRGPGDFFLQCGRKICEVTHEKRTTFFWYKGFWSPYNVAMLPVF